MLQNIKRINKTEILTYKILCVILTLVTTKGNFNVLYNPTQQTNFERLVLKTRRLLRLDKSFKTRP
jgi:hypothetical protein